jgi:uncharacterized protein
LRLRDDEASLSPVDDLYRLERFDAATIERAAKLLRVAAPQGSEIILFGSYARGDADERSDVDFLVVEPEVHSRHSEAARLREVLRPLGLAVDVIVTSRRDYEYWADNPGTLSWEVHREGRSVGSSE